MTVETVVARYKEDIDWVEGLPNIRVYNKFYDVGLTLPNVGREAHTYLSHIIKNYHDLADTVVFLQAEFLCHIPRPKGVNKEKIMQIIRGELPVDNYLTFGKMHPPTSTQHVFSSRRFFLRRWARLMDREFPVPAEQLAQLNFAMYEGALFAVPSRIIRARSRDWYISALEMTFESHGAHFFERIWPFVFDADHLVLKCLKGF